LYYVYCRFHTYNGGRASETVPAGVQFSEDELYARPHEVGQPKVFKNVQPSSENSFCGLVIASS